MISFRSLKSNLQSPHLVPMVCFGVASGMPASFMFSTLSMWLMEGHLSLTLIGSVAWTSLPYTLKTFLSPLVDMITLKGLTRWAGRRRGWALLMQAGIASGFFALSLIHPSKDLSLTLLLCTLLNLCAALQDITLEAYRIEIIPPASQNIAAGANAFGFRLGMWAASYLPLIVAHYGSWPLALRMMSGCMILVMGSVFALPEPRHAAPRKSAVSLSTYLQTLKRSFFFFHETYGAFRAFGLFASYKLGDVFIRSMWGLFLISSNYSKKEIANVEKGLGMGAMLLGVIIGTAFIQKKTIRAGLILWGALQALMALLFVWHALVGHHSLLLILSITLNQLVGGIGAAISVAYLSSLCRAPGVPEQYALMTSAGSLARILTTSLAGGLAQVCPWPLFFAVSALICLPLLVFAIRAYPRAKSLPPQEGAL